MHLLKLSMANNILRRQMFIALEFYSTNIFSYNFPVKINLKTFVDFKWNYKKSLSNLISILKELWKRNKKSKKF
jgi:hypothetical protein